MTDSRGEGDRTIPGADVTVDAEPAVDEIFELMPEESPEEVIALAEREHSGEVTEESVFDELAEELSVPGTTDTTHAESTLDVPAIDELFSEQ